MYERQESEYFRAKLKAARRLCRGWAKPKDLPSNAEIRDQIELLAQLHEGDRRKNRLCDMRVAALALMETLERFRPRLIGSVLTGHIRQGSDIDIHVFADSPASVTHALEQEGRIFTVERKEVQKAGETRHYTHVHLAEQFPFELTVYRSDEAHVVFRSSITGKPIERAGIRELRQLLQEWRPELDLDAELAAHSERIDRFAAYEALLLPLENVAQDLRYHPEGDVLYHSLQVFDLARDELPYDEEFLLAALLHDVGKGIDGERHVESGLEALEGLITERTAWLIEHHMLAHAIDDRSLGRRAHRRLREAEHYDDLLLLGKLDREGRRAGVQTCDVEEALAYLRDLAAMCG